MSRYSLSPAQHIVQQHGRGEILARKVKAYSFFYLLDAKAVAFICRFDLTGLKRGAANFYRASFPSSGAYLLESEC